MISEITFVVQIAIGIVFIWSAFQKGLDPAGFMEGIHAFEIIPTSLVSTAALGIVLTELAIGVSHITGWFLPQAVLVGIGLLVVFSATVLIVIRRGTIASCLCFGANDSEAVSKRTLFRLMLLLCGEASLFARLAETQVGAVPSIESLLSASLSLLLASWLLALPDLLSLRRWCRTCTK